jgi:hypothetical protein
LIAVDTRFISCVTVKQTKVKQEINQVSTAIKQTKVKQEINQVSTAINQTKVTQEINQVSTDKEVSFNEILVVLYKKGCFVHVRCNLISNRDFLCPWLFLFNYYHH